jgi:hypothetical protein
MVTRSQMDQDLHSGPRNNQLSIFEQLLNLFQPLFSHLLNENNNTIS